MFRNQNIYEENKEYKYVLMKNVKTSSAIIPNDYIQERYDVFRDPAKLTIQIPYYITNKIGEKVVNKIATKFLGKGQRINVYYKEQPVETFIITNLKKTDSYYGTNTELRGQRIIEVEAHSYEKTLEESDCTLENCTVQLYHKEEDTTNVTNGILNYFEEDNPLWKVKYVSDQARKEFAITEVIHEEKVGENIIINKMDRPSVLLDADVSLKLAEYEPPKSNLADSKGNLLMDKNDYLLASNDVGVAQTKNTDDINLINLSVYFTNINIYSALNGELELTNVKIFHEDILKSYDNITRIKITYMTTEEYRHCFRYEIWLSDGNVIVKDREVSCYSDLRFEIGSIYVRYTNGQEEYKNSIKYRTFEQGTQKWLTFLRENVESAYNVVFDFDTYNRWLYCYSINEVGEHTGIKLTYQNYLEEMQIEPEYDKVVSKLWVTSENCQIADVNPIGTNYIYDFSYFVNNGLLTEECCKALERYEAVISSSENHLDELREGRNTAVKRRIRLETELQEKETMYSDVSNILAVYIKEENEDKVAEYGEKKATLEKEITQLISAIAEQKDYIESIDSEIDVYLKKVTLETCYDDEGTIFNEDLLTELNLNIIEKELKDESFITAQSLYDYALEQLKTWNGLQLQLTVTINGLKERMVTPKDLSWNEIIKVGNFFTVIEFNEPQRIVGVKYSPKENTIKEIELSNTLERVDNYSKLNDLSTVITQAQYTMETMKNVWEDSADANDFYKKMKNQYLDNVATGIKGRSQNCILDMTSGSIFVIDADDKDSQVYIGAGLVAFTDDGWLTAKTAIDKEGITANYLVGEIILGKQLYITSDNGEFYIGDMNNTSQGFGLKITDSNKIERIFLGTEIVNGKRTARLRLYNKNGTGTCISEDGIIQTYQFSDRDHVDPFNRAYFYFWSDTNVIDYKSIYMHIVFKPYRVYSKSLKAGGVVNQHTGTTVTGGGGATTSASGGGYAGTSATGGGYSSSYAVTSSAENWNTASGSGGVMSTPTWDSVATVKNFDNHYHNIRKDYLRHTHTVSISINVPDHYHSVSIPSHTHYVEIPAHSHSIDLSFSTEHTHEIEYGIIDLDGEENYPSNVTLIVNGKWVKDYIQNNETIDIKDYITKGITTCNTIQLTSSSRGIFHVSFFIKAYTSWE